MNDKTKLIDSMANLIQHVSISQKNQEQIFATLSVGDVKKILSNLEDSNEKLRKTTLMLLSQLLYQNPSLQRRFCQLTNTPQFPGKIVLSQRFPKSILCQAQFLKEVVKILKDNSTIKQRGLFWYIDGQSKPKILQIAKRNSYTIDPLNCVVGVWIQQEKQQAVRMSLNINPLNSSYNQPQIINNSKARLNKSYNFEKSSNATDYKPETPMKISLVDVGVTDNGRYRVSSYIEQTSPIQIKSQIKNTFKQQQHTRLISATERKNYQPIASTNNYDTVKYIKPNLYISTPGQGSITPQSYQFSQPKTIQPTTISTTTNRANGQFKSYVFPRPQFRKN